MTSKRRDAPQIQDNNHFGFGTGGTVGTRFSKTLLKNNNLLLDSKKGVPSVPSVPKNIFKIAFSS